MAIHTTRIQSNSRFIIHRRFPPQVAARIPVSNNQKLSPVQIVAQTSHETGYEIVPISELLGINNNDLDSHLKVRLGELVRLGSVLAERKKMFGRAEHVTSPIEGTVSEIQNGNLFITRIPEDLNLRSLVHGTVSQVIPGKGAIIEVVGSNFQAAWNNGVEGAGNLKVLGQTNNEALQIEHLDVDLYGSIAAIGHLGQPELLSSLLDSGAAGLIVGTISPDAFQAAATWQLPLTLTDGAGIGGIYPAIFEVLHENNGNHSALFSNQYSETNRPEVVMVNSQLDDAAVMKRQKEDTPLKVGQKVRLLAGASRGQEGIVRKTYSWPQNTATGFKTRGVDVETENGEVTFVSTANLDRIM